MEVTLCDKLTFHFNGNWVGRERQKLRTKCLWSLSIWICDKFSIIHGLTGGIFNIYSFPFKFYVKLCTFYDANADMEMR